MVRRAPGPDELAQLSRSVVKVRSGDCFASGFVFGSPRHVLTSYLHVDESSEHEVISSDGTARAARVVAWSEEDDLALLEVDHDLAPPLRAAAARPALATPIAVLYHPARPDAHEDEARAWSSPVVLFGHVGRVLPAQIDLDVGLWGRPGDAGAPILDDEGGVVAVVSQRSFEERRMIATRLERAQVLWAVRYRQGEFSRSHEVKWFVGLFVAPWQRQGLLGAGLNFGMAYDWFALELLEGFFQSGYRPTGDAGLRSVQRFQVELDAQVRIRIATRAHIFFGPGIQLNSDSIETVEDVTSSNVTPSDDDELGVRPCGTLGVTAAFLRLRLEVSENPRVDLGVVVGDY